MKRILLTGATGFVGQRLLHRLLQDPAQSYHITALLKPGDKLDAPVEQMFVDLNSTFSWDVVPVHTDMVLHLAGKTSLEPDVWGSFSEAIQVNTMATSTLLDGAKRRAVAQFLCISTTEVFEPHLDPWELLDEESPFASAPAHPFVLSKLWAEQAAATFRLWLPKVSILRPSLIYGPGSSDSNPLKRIERRIQRGEPVHLAGHDGAIVSPIFVDDLVDVIQWVIGKTEHYTINVVGSETMFERRMYEDIGRQLGMEPNFVVHKRQPRHVASSGKHLTALNSNWQPTTWMSGLKLTWPILPAGVV